MAGGHSEDLFHRLPSSRTVTTRRGGFRFESEAGRTPVGEESRSWPWDPLGSPPQLPPDPGRYGAEEPVSALFSIQALWTAAHLDLPITYVIPNNRGYRILKQRLLSFHGNQNYVGMDLMDPEIDFVGLAKSLGVEAERITDPAAIRPAIETSVAAGKPRLLDVAVDRTA